MWHAHTGNVNHYYGFPILHSTSACVNDCLLKCKPFDKPLHLLLGHYVSWILKSHYALVSYLHCVSLVPPGYLYLIASFESFWYRPFFFSLSLPSFLWSKGTNRLPPFKLVDQSHFSSFQVLFTSFWLGLAPTLHAGLFLGPHHFNHDNLFGFICLHHCDHCWAIAQPAFGHFLGHARKIIGYSFPRTIT